MIKYSLFPRIGKLLPAVALIGAICLTQASGGFTKIAFAEDLPVQEETESGTAVAGAPADNGFIMSYENDKLRLYCATADDHIGNFAVESKADGTVWYGSPLDAVSDFVTLDTASLRSLLTIQYYDEATSAMVTLSSQADSIEQGGLRLQQLKNGLRFNFTFPQIQVMVPLTILVNDDGSLTAKVAVDAIEEKGDYRIFSIQMLPYFCAGSEADDGFMLIPDGSGAVMEFNNGKVMYPMYKEAVYGGDAGDIPDTQITTTEKIYLPVFGMEKNGSAIFSVITDGAAQSEISATVSGIDSGYNAVWNSFSIRKVTTYSLDQGWQGKKTFYVYQETAPTIKNVENTYFFLKGGAQALDEMAACYRNYLTKNGVKQVEKAAEPAVCIDYLGAITRKKSVVGFPMDTKMVATSFEEALEITRGLHDNGVNSLNIRYFEWDKRSVEQKIRDKAKPEPKLGGKSAFLNLRDYAKQNGIGFYPDVDLTRFGKTSFPFQQYIDATRNMNLEINRYFPYKLNLMNQNLSRKFWYMLNMGKLSKVAGSFMKSYAKLELGTLSLSSLPSVVTSDYSNKKETHELWSGAEVYRKQIEQISTQAGLMMDAPLAHALPYAEQLVNMPESSCYDMTDYEVPFYQMAVSELIPYTGRAVNLAADPQKAFLKVLETGSGLHYSLTKHAESNVVKDTLYDSWIGADAAQWGDMIAEQYQEMKKVYGELGSSCLIGYEKRESGLTVSRFKGGGELWINASDAALTDNGVTVEANSYIIRKAGASNE